MASAAKPACRQAGHLTEFSTLGVETFPPPGWKSYRNVVRYIALLVLILSLGHPETSSAALEAAPPGKVRAKIEFTWDLQANANYPDPPRKEETIQIRGHADISASFIEVHYYKNPPAEWTQYGGQMPMALVPVGNFSYRIDGNRQYFYRWAVSDEGVFGAYIYRPQVRRASGFEQSTTTDHCTASETFSGAQYISQGDIIRRAGGSLPALPGAQSMANMLILDQTGPMHLQLEKQPDGSHLYTLRLNSKATCTGQTTWRTEKEAGTGEGRWGEWKDMVAEIKGIIPKGQKSVPLTLENFHESWGWTQVYQPMQSEQARYSVAGYFTLDPSVFLKRGVVAEEFCDKICPTMVCSWKGFRISLDDERVKVTVRIRNEIFDAGPADELQTTRTDQEEIDLSPTGGSTEPPPVTPDSLRRLQDLWTMEIHSAWNERFVIERADGQGGAIPAEFSVEFVEEGADQVVNVIPGTGRSDTENWYAMDHGYAAHEFGHYLGLDDEYAEEEACPGRKEAREPNIMSDNVSAVKTQHMEPITTWLQNATGVPWVARPRR